MLLWQIKLMGTNGWQSSVDQRSVLDRGMIEDARWLVALMGSIRIRMSPVLVGVTVGTWTFNDLAVP